MLLVTEICWLAGTVLFAANVKLSELGFAESGLEPVELTFRTTATDKNAPGAVTLMKPTSVPDVGAPGPTETVNERGVVPLVGVTTSHLFVDVAEIVTLVGSLDDVSNKVCGVGVTPA